MRVSLRLLTFALALLVSQAGNAHAAIGLFHKSPKKTTAELRAEYLANVSQSATGNSQSRTSGSLWTSDGLMVEPAADYKAHSLNDIVTVLVSVQTTAAQSGSVDSERNFNTNSAITGLAGALSTKGTNPLLAASSSTTLKGTGSTNSSTAFSTSLTGQIIAVLPNGNLVIEAHRQIDMDNQHEEVLVRGIARPGDITPSNSVPSSSLSALEIELKGKGIISDSVRPPNALTRAILWLFGF
jgi:flagellar L-ring protein precursor FlgH